MNAVKGQWILPSDRYPEEGVPVLAHTSSGEIKQCFFSDDMLGGLFIANRGHALSSIVHWMPLPEPPHALDTPNLCLGEPKPIDGGWILLSERFPDECDDILICCFDGAVETSWLQDGAFGGCHNFRFMSEVFCWMPLPDPPKEGTDDGQ